MARRQLERVKKKRQWAVRAKTNSNRKKKNSTAKQNLQQQVGANSQAGDAFVAMLMALWLSAVGAICNNNNN